MHSRNMKFVRLAFTSLLMFTGIRQAEASIVETWFPASSFNSNTAAMDATLAITGYLEDTFETTTLIPGLGITLSGSVPSTTWNALPSTFNPITQGDGFETNTQWDGTDVVDNGTNNQLHNNPWASVITFNYAAGATSFGIGLSGFQSTNPAGAFPITNHELFINGMDIGTIETLPAQTGPPASGGMLICGWTSPVAAPLPPSGSRIFRRPTARTFSSSITWRSRRRSLPHQSLRPSGCCLLPGQGWVQCTGCGDVNKSRPVLIKTRWAVRFDPSTHLVP